VRERFLAMMRDDLGTPQALSVLWDSLKSEDYTSKEKWGLLEDAEAHLGLSLLHPPARNTLLEKDLSEDLQNMLRKRATARASQDFKEADRIRDEILHRGYRVDDGPDGPMLTETTL
jgi:cysteinyl-tRNA synthetase